MLLSLLIGRTPRAFAFLITSVTDSADTSASGANATEPSAKSTEVDRSVIAVSRRSSCEERKIAVAAGVDEAFCLQLVFPGMVGEAKSRDGVVCPIRAANESV